MEPFIQKRLWTPDPHVLAAWRAQVNDTGHCPSLEPRLAQRERELLPRFSAHYKLLKALPRRSRRLLQRQWKQTLGGLALLLALGQAPALAATINVGGGCSLVDAITAANTDTATNGCPAGNGADTLVLPANSTQTLTAVDNTVYGATGLPTIASEIIIQGNNSTIRRQASAPDFRILAMGQGGNLTLEETTISGGVSSGIGGIASSGGGVINRVFEGEDNTGRATLTLIDSTVSGNSARYNGGGVFSNGVLTLIDSTVSGNSARFDGGGVYTYNSGGDLTLIDSTVSGNSAGSSGGGVFNRSEYYEYYDPNYVKIIDSTVSGNSAGNRGGGVYNRLFVGIGPFTLSRTLISGNSAPDGAEIYNSDYRSGAFRADDFNLLGHAGLSSAQAYSGFTPGPSDITATSDGTQPTALASILDTTLSDNGGPTRTHALVTGSPAVDAAGNDCSAADQRGVTRPQGPACDSGAFELDQDVDPATLCAGEEATIVGTAFDDVLVGTPGRDVIKGLAGNDTIHGLGGDDLICAGGGNDTVHAGAGDDQVFGNGGDDVLLGETGDDRLFGQAGRDQLDGNAGNDRLFGGAADDRVIGGAGNDLLDGGGGNDDLRGNAGNDRLFGGGGNDAMNGGTGTDTCDGGPGNGDSAVNCETISNVP